MIFEYSKYLDRLFWNPVIACIFVFIFGIYGVYGNILIIKKEKKIVETIPKIFFVILICLYIITNDTIPKLKNGGIYLFSENGTQCATTINMIENIYNPSNRLNGFKSSYGADIEMDGVLYFIESIDGFAVGDEVEIKYLPKSKCVLEIKKINEAS